MGSGRALPRAGVKHLKKGRKLQREMEQPSMARSTIHKCYAR